MDTTPDEDYPPRPAVPAIPPLYDRNFILASSVALLGSMSGNMLIHFSRMVKFMGGDDIFVGWVIGLPPLLILPLWPYIGLLQDRFGIQRLWAVGLGLAGSALIVWGAWPTLGWPVFAARILMGVGFALVLTAVSAYAAAVSPEERRNEAIGSMGIGGFVGAIIGPPLGNFILGPEPSRTLLGFQYIIWIAGGACLIGAVLAAILRREPQHPHEPGWFARPWLILARHWPGMVVLTCVAFGLSILSFNMLIPLFTDARHLSQISWFYVTYASMGLLVRLVGRRWGDRFGVPTMAAVGVGLFTLAWICTPTLVGTESWRLLIPGVLGGLGHGILFPTAAYLMVSRLPTENRGLGVSLAWAFIDGSAIIGGPIFGWIAQSAGYEAVFFTLAGLVLGLGSLGVMAARRKGMRNE